MVFLLIPAQVKQEVLKRLKRRDHESKAAMLMVFAAGLALLLHGWGQQAATILIDDEYTGQQAAIKSRLLLYLERGGAAPPGVIRFGRVGQAPPSHKLANAVYRGERAPDHVVTTRELMVAVDIKQRRRGPQSGTV